MRAQVALGVVLVLLIVGTASSATATEASKPMAYDTQLAPLTLSLVTGDAEASAQGSVTGPGTASATAPIVLEDPGAAPVPSAVARVQPPADAGVVVKPTPRPKAAPRPKTSATRPSRSSSHASGHVLRGPASWYCNRDGSRGPISACMRGYPDTGGFNAYAAAGPKLRAAMGGNWRGRIVLVDGVRVKLVDWCQCYKGQSNEKLIDLYRDVYGVVGGSVTIRW